LKLEDFNSSLVLSFGKLWLEKS